MKWFRFWTETLNDPKVQRLPDKLYRFWTNMLILASANDGILPDTEDIIFAVRLRPQTTEALLSELIHRRLLDTDGTRITPHNWERWQYKSDNVTERVREHRIRVSRNGTETLQEPPMQLPQKQIQRTETEQKQKSGGGSTHTRVAKAAKSKPRGKNP